MGAAYPQVGPPVALSETDRIFNPLPAFHINAGVVSFLGAMLVGAALIRSRKGSARGSGGATFRRPRRRSSTIWA
ncbi:MAG: hypothetical protein R3D85_08175 [Paracoccaceae bacterium]